MTRVRGTKELKGEVASLRGNAAVAAVKATDAAIVSARNAYFYENHAPVLAASEAQQTRLEFVQAELLRERTRFAEFVVERVTPRRSRPCCTTAGPTLPPRARSEQ